MYELEATADMLLMTPEAKTSIEPTNEIAIEVGDLAAIEGLSRGGLVLWPIR